MFGLLIDKHRVLGSLHCILQSCLVAISLYLVTLSDQSINVALERLDLPLPLPEIHGLCCGLLCSMSSTAAKTRWFTELLDAAALKSDAVASKASELKVLDEWFSETLASLNDVELEFSPAMPDDALPVALRIRALGEFCGGFTYGLGIALSQRGQKPIPADTLEIIEDFQAIESADLEESDLQHSSHGPLQRDFPPKSKDGSENEDAQMDGATDEEEQQEVVYNELLEYVRVGVLLVLEELRPVTNVTQVKPS
ncbi:MAG: hypothetical protein ACJA0Z_003763 [Halioglobus sp.]|jgi:uncharacterized protein YgfB (UPF0149 family)